MKLHLVACGKLKRPTACVAQDLYVGDLFQKARAYAERRGPWAILSAKHGLVLPTTRLEPYNQTLIGAPPAVRTEWAALVARQLREAFPNLTEVVFLAGRDYRYPLEALLSATGIACSAPMQGLGLGQQKQWLMRNPTDAALLRRMRIHADTENYPEGEAVFTATLGGKTIGTLQIVNPSKAPEESELYESAGDIDGPMALMVFVDEKYRRRGVAQALYAAAEKHFGETIKESPDQTAAGAALRGSMRNPRGMRPHYDFSKGRRNVYARLLGMPKLSAKARRQLRRGARVEMERRLKRKNPRLGNTGWEFKQAAARQMLVEAITLAGANPGAVDGLLVQAFAYAKRRWEQAHNRILPVREYPALLHATTLELARMVASGEMTR